MFYVTFFYLKQNKEVASWRRHAVRVTRGERNREFARRITITYSLTNALGHGLYSARCRQHPALFGGQVATKYSDRLAWLDSRSASCKQCISAGQSGLDRGILVFSHSRQPVLYLLFGARDLFVH